MLPNNEPAYYEVYRSYIYRKTHALPILRFEDQQLTSFSGLVVFQKLFEQFSIDIW